MTNITGGVGDQNFVYQRTGPNNDTIIDFGSIYFTIDADGSQETEPNNSAATATGTAMLNRAQTRLEIGYTVVGLDIDGTQTASTDDDVGGMHIHVAPAGSNGGVRFGFRGSSDTNGDLVIDGATGTVFSAWDANEGNNTTLTAELAAILADGSYLNLHTPLFPSGEIRGQVLRADNGDDRIDISAFNISDFSTVQAILSDVGGDATLTSIFNGQVSTLTLAGVASGDLTEADFIFGGTGSQTDIGTDNVDFLFGGDGDDILDGLRGNDTLFGGDGADILNGDNGADILNGDGGADTLNGSTGNDTLNGGAGNDVLHGGQGRDTLEGGEDDDTLLGGTGADALFGGNGVDTLSGGSGADTIEGGVGNDTINGQGFTDILRGGDGNDIISGGGSADELFGDAGSDELSGNNGADNLSGGAGNDTLNGGQDNDTVRGGSGRDNILGSTGDDRLYGDGAADTFQFRANHGFDRIFDFQDGTDVIQFNIGSVNDISDLTLRNVFAGVDIDYGTGTIRVLGSTDADFSNTDFEFL